MFVTPAFAQASPLGGDNLMVSLLPFVLIFVIMYFLILRPQQKRVKDHAEVVKNLRRGDIVGTSGGAIGKGPKGIDDGICEGEGGGGGRGRQMRLVVFGGRAQGGP